MFKTFSNNFLINSSELVKKVSIPTTYRHNGKCIICKRFNIDKLQRIKQNAILDAYSNYNIFIKKGARCCKRHLNKNKNIRPEEFYKIKLKYSTHLKFNKIMYDYLVQLNSKECCIFDIFAEIDEEDDSLCKEITRWPKDVFIRFSNYITSINENFCRNKYHLKNI